MTLTFQTAEEIAEITPLNPFDRFADGRPAVPDDLVERMRLVTTEEAWSVLRRHGYHHQFERNWINIHPDRILVGRAVTCAYVPIRPDYHEVVQRRGLAERRIGGQNSWVIDTLRKDDVLVVDLFGKITNGTFVGDNLSTSVQAKTKAGLVIDGGIRDYQRIVELPDFNIFCRGIDPTAIAEVTLRGVNVPVRIGAATVLPGDIVLGTPTGVIFIPPQLAQEVVEHSEDTRLRDRWGKAKLAEGKYTPGEIDVSTWEPHIEADFQQWRKTEGG